MTVRGDGARDLAVLRRFDVELCRGLLGDDALAIVSSLREAGELADVPDHPGALRFAESRRRQLVDDLRWADPDRHEALQRRAAELWARRGDVVEAHHHLLAAGDPQAGFELTIRPALDLADRGDRYGLARLVSSLPTVAEVDDPTLALDLAVVTYFARRTAEAGRWCDRAEELAGALDVDSTRRVESLRALLAMVAGDLDGARLHQRRLDGAGPGAGLGDPVSRWYPAVRARIALLGGDLVRARDAIEEVGSLDEPATVVKVTFPALQAWYELELGHLRPALALAEQAAAWAASEQVELHLGAFDAFLVLGRCLLGAGELTAAEESLEVARRHADALGHPVFVARAAAVAAEVARAQGEPRRGTELVRDARVQLGAQPPHALAPATAAVLDGSEAATLVADGRFDEGAALVDTLPDGPARRLVTARGALAAGRAADVAPALGSTDGWAVPQRLEADVLRATAGGEGLDAALGVGHDTGWVSPFLGLPAPVAAMLSTAPVERRHPALAAALAPDRGARSRASRSGPPGPLEPLTTRELELLAFLPTHLSYAQIAERVYLSVNTVKTTLKSVYRKLHAASRAEAVESARRAGLL